MATSPEPRPADAPASSSEGRDSNVLARALLAGTGLALAGGLGRVAIGRIAAGVRRTHDARLDDAMVPPTDVHHGSFERPDGARIHYVDTAPGSALPPVVLLHGITLQWWMWSSVIRELRDEARVIAWDMRGFGSSTAGSGLTIEAAAADLAALLDTLDLHDAIVVGHSMGGMELGRFAVDHAKVRRERVAGLVFLDTAARAGAGTLLTGGLVRLSPFTAKLAATGLVGRFRWHDNDLSIAALRGGFGRVATARMVEDLRRCQAEAPVSSLQDGARTIAEHDVLRGLSGVDTPTVVVVGEFDRLTPPLHARELAAAIPGARLVVLPGLGHNTMQEAPEAVADAVRSLR